MNYQSKVIVIRLNGGSTEMQVEGTDRTFKRDIVLPWSADSFIVRQIQVGSLNQAVNAGVYTIATDMMGGKEEIACFAEGTSLCPQTIFTTPVKSGTYNFHICKGYVTENNNKSNVNTDFRNEAVLVLEFVKFK